MKTITVGLVLAALLCCGAGCCDRQCQDKLAELKAEQGLLEANKALVHRTHEEVWSNGNLAVVDELYSADYIGHWVSGEDTDREVLKQIVAESLAAFPDKTEEVVHIVAEGDLVVTHFIASGTFVGGTEGTQSEGKRISRPEIAIHRIVDGKIVEQWTVSDQLTLMQQLGLQ